MTRTMYDGINALTLPSTGAQMVAGYTDGTWPSLAAMVVRFPGLVHVAITVHPADNEGVVFDCEKGNGTPEDAVNWVLRRRASGADPTVYCNTSTWPSVKAAFNTHDVPPPHYWVADYDGVAAIPAGAVAKQYASHSGYDISVVADYWPGVDSAPIAAGGSAAVHALQSEINATAFTPKLALDGQKGPLTKAGFAWVMRQYGLMRQGGVSIGVGTVQAMLNTWSAYDLVLDGQFGAKTLAAVRDFQSRHPAAGGVDGVVGPDTKAALAA